jgi:hypothetical protein
VTRLTTRVVRGSSAYEKSRAVTTLVNAQRTSTAIRGF